MGDDGRRKPNWFLTALAWWTLAGTVFSIVGLFTDVPKSGFLWPTEIQPHWLGACIGGAVFLVLAGTISASAQRAPDGESPAGD